MKKVIAVTNQKGGIGKTTTVTSIAAILQKRGYKTLVIDADVQCNTTDTFRAEYEGVPTLFDVMLEETNPVSINNAIQHTEMGDIIASDPLLNETDARLSVKGMKGLKRLKNAIDQLEGYDYVIIDTHPSIDMMLRNVLVACDEILIPMMAGRYSFQGINDLVEAIDDAKGLNPNLKIAGILRVCYKETTNVGKGTSIALDRVGEALNAPVFNSIIRDCVKIPEAQSERMTLLKYSKSCIAEHDYEDFVEEYLGI